MTNDLIEPVGKFCSSSPDKATGPGTHAPLSQNPGVPDDVRALLGPSWIIEGEDPKLYEKLLAEVGAAVQPADIIDWLLVKDVVAHTWEIQRSRRYRDSLIRMARRAAMEQILDSILSHNRAIHTFGQESSASRTAREWFNGDKQAAKIVDQLLRDAGLSVADVTAQSLALKAVELDKLDQQNQRHEERRDAILLQIERRRAGWARQVRRAADDVVDAEFRETIPGALGSGAARKVSAGA